MQAKQGFTLIELLVVVLIVGILAAVALPQYATAVEKSRSVEALSLMSAVVDSAERYRLQKDVWPGSNDFNKLDVEIPKITLNGATAYGGKNFEIRMGNNGNAGGNTFVAAAIRNLQGEGKYVLKTIVTENNDGTFTILRNCGTTADASTTNTAPTANTNAEKFCAAVTSGNISDF